MHLQLLRSTRHVSIYYDSYNDWLFIEWQGVLDLRAVQLACLELALVCLRRRYRRVLNSNVQVLGADWDVPAWLAHDFLPYLALAGIEQVAWVSGRSVGGQDVVQGIVNRLPPLPLVVFDDLEMAVDWLQRTRLAPTTNGYELLTERLPAVESLLRQAVRTFTNRVLGKLAPQQIMPA